MAASAGTMIVRNLKGITSQVDLYQPDAISTNIAFSRSGLAGAASPTFVTFGEDVVISDISIVTGATAVGGAFLLDDNRMPSSVRWANHLNTLASRPILNFFVRAGQRFGIIQY